MAASFRQSLNSGRATEIERSLRRVVSLLDDILGDIRDETDSETEGDNAADNGGLVETLRIAKRLINEELPSGNCQTCGRVRSGP